MKLRKSGKELRVPPGITIKPELHLSVDSEDREPESGLTAVDEPGLTIDLDATYSPARGRYLVDSLRVSRRDGGPEITGKLLRGIRVQLMMRWLVNNTASDDVVSEEEDPLRQIALTYRLAEIAGDPPAKAVADQHGLGQRSATNWIRKARQAGAFDLPESKEWKLDGAGESTGIITVIGKGGSGSGPIHFEIGPDEAGPLIPIPLAGSTSHTSD